MFAQEFTETVHREKAVTRHGEFGEISELGIGEHLDNLLGFHAGGIHHGHHRTGTHSGYGIGSYPHLFESHQGSGVRKASRPAPAEDETQFIGLTRKS